MFTKVPPIYTNPQLLLGDDQTPKIIQGIEVDSKEEWNWYLASRRFGWPGEKFVFQVPINGGRTRRGGLLIDFLFFTVPLWTPVFIDGEYWHRYSLEDALKRSKIKAILGFSKDPVSVSADDIPNEETANAKFLEIIGPY